MICKMIRDAIFFREEELSFNGLDFASVCNGDIRMLLEEAVDKSVIILLLNNCKLTSLKDIPVLRKLQRLELADNPFPAKDLEHLIEFDSLVSLNLSRTQINAVNDLRPLRRLPSLIQLELEDVRLADQSEFKTLLVDLLPRLQYLNSQPLERTNKTLLEQLNMKTF